MLTKLLEFLKAVWGNKTLMTFLLIIYSVFITIKYFEKPTGGIVTPVTNPPAAVIPVITHPDTAKPPQATVPAPDTVFVNINKGPNGLFTDNYDILEGWLSIKDTTKYNVQDSIIKFISSHSYSINKFITLTDTINYLGRNNFTQSYNISPALASSFINFNLVTRDFSPIITPAPPVIKDMHLIQLWGVAGYEFVNKLPYIGADLMIGDYGIGPRLGYKYEAVEVKLRF